MPLGDLPEAVTTVSSLIPSRFMTKATIEEIIALTQKTLVDEAMRGFPAGTKVTIRDLAPKDLGYTNEEYIETSGADNSYADTVVAAKSVADETYIAIYGVAVHFTVATAYLVATPAITELRFTVGASKVARWRLEHAVPYMIYEDNGTSGVAGVLSEPLVSIAQSPIIIGKNGVITIEEYTVEATIVYKPYYLGFVCEKQGKTFNP